jgi:hypothetical protein
VADVEDMKTTKDELAIYDDVGRLAKALWEKSVGIAGKITDPKMYSAMLFQRLWTHQQAYTQLWNDEAFLEGAIILRSSLETAIALAALDVLQDQFVTLMRQDAGFTLQGRIKMYRAEGADKLVAGTEEVYRTIMNDLPEGTKAAKLDFKKLADDGKVPLLHSWHRNLSGISSHVTGLSVISALGGDGIDQRQLQLRNHTRKMQPMMMVCAVHTGALHHAIMIEENNLYAEALAIGDRLNVISEHWPGVAEGRDQGAVGDANAAEGA